MTVKVLTLIQGWAVFSVFWMILVAVCYILILYRQNSIDQKLLEERRDDELSLRKLRKAEEKFKHGGLVKEEPVIRPESKPRSIDHTYKDEDESVDFEVNEDPYVAVRWTNWGLIVKDPPIIIGFPKNTHGRK